ncbi:MAG: hypothetical protein WD226_03170 [Planctomycetota bacterium]
MNVLLLACLLPLQDLTPGTAGQAAAEGAALVHYLRQHGALANVTATLVAEAATVTCPGESPESVQFATSRRFRAPNGFVLANGWPEDLDDDGAPTGNGGCASPTGAIGTGTTCEGADPLLASWLAGPPSLVEGARLEVEFDVLVPATLWVDWAFVTFESPADATFFDVFGIVFEDGGGAVLLAGGTTNGGPAAASLDLGWSLAPATADEYQDVNFPGGFHQLPAYETGRRRLELALQPGVGQRLSFHVADSGPTIPSPPLCAPGETAADPTVHSALFASSGAYAGPAPNGVTPGVSLDRAGHPGAPSFPGDFELVVGGNAAGGTVLLGTGNAPLAPWHSPLLAPWTLYVAPASIGSRPVDLDGIARFAFPNDLSSISGAYYAQAFTLLPGGAGLTASPGLRVLF